MSGQPVITNFELSNNNNNNTGWLKSNVYIQQKLLRATMNYVEFEEWFQYDKSIFELHHYFEYKFKTNYIAKELKIQHFGAHKLVLMDTGLYRSEDGELLYLVCNQNAEHRQPWRTFTVVKDDDILLVVGFIKPFIHYTQLTLMESMVTLIRKYLNLQMILPLKSKQELIHEYKNVYIPDTQDKLQINYCIEEFSECMFDDKQIRNDLTKILTSQKRKQPIISNITQSLWYASDLRSKIIDLFVQSVHERTHSQLKEYIIPGLFIDGEAFKISPMMIIDIKYKEISRIFMIRLEKSDNKYIIKKILNHRQGFHNARQVCQVNPKWYYKMRNKPSFKYHIMNSLSCKYSVSQCIDDVTSSYQVDYTNSKIIIYENQNESIQNLW